MSGGLSLPGDAAAAAPLVAFAVEIALVQGPFLGQKWPSAAGVRVAAPRDRDTSGGINAGKRLRERKREGLGWVCKSSLREEGCRAGFGVGTICRVYHLVDCIFTAPKPFYLDRYGLVHSSIYPLSPK